MDTKKNFNQTEDNANKRKSILRKSASTIGFISGYANVSVREARSFTGALEELKSNVKNSHPAQLEHTVNYHQKGCITESDPEEINESGYITKEYFSNQVYIVTEEMLSYRGRKYSLNDIATRWKKDCRMWLWKNRNTKKCNKSMSQLHEKLENIKILSK